MLSVLGRRIFLEALPTLLYLVALTFFLLRVVPGGPFDGERAWPPEVKAELERRYGLDQPLPAQFGHWLSGLARGDLGSSFQYQDQGVSSMIADALPVSLSLGAWALALSIALGISLGGLAAWKRGSPLDRATLYGTIAAMSLPPYLPAAVGVLVFALWLGWLPPALWESPASMVLPVATLALRPTAILTRLVRASMIESLGADYIRTALGKGLP
ncbi:MAG TPA: ABC transporter permease, partial [Bdellovibrionota bacterium]|nr:ABC transporter permease [Bdellovibrionota bacterium]